MIEKKIYSGWDFTENEKEKGAMNAEIYRELKTKHRVYRNDLKSDPEVNLDECEVAIGRKAGYKQSSYYILKNGPKLNMDELALICDHGNLCFGYTLEYGLIKVFED